LLPLCDSFRMAMANQEAWNAIDENWRKGVESIYTQLQGILKDYHAAPIDPVGKTFDPEIHEAVGNKPVTDETQHETVVETMQLGYSITNGAETDIVRPARVIVGNFES